MKMLKIVIFATILSGCASTGDVQHIQSQIDDMNATVNKINSDSKKAVHEAQDAALWATRAEIETHRTFRKVTAILDAMFEQSMQK